MARTPRPVDGRKAETAAGWEAGWERRIVAVGGHGGARKRAEGDGAVGVRSGERAVARELRQWKTDGGRQAVARGRLAPTAPSVAEP